MIHHMKICHLLVNGFHSAMEQHTTPHTAEDTAHPWFLDKRGLAQGVNKYINRALTLGQVQKNIMLELLMSKV